MAVISQNRQQQGAPGWLPNRANKFTSRLVAYTVLQIIGYFAIDILARELSALDTLQMRCRYRLGSPSALFICVSLLRIFGIANRAVRYLLFGELEI